MELKYTQCPKPTRRPCLMQNEFGEVFLVTDGLEKGKIYVTRVSCDADDVETWESDLKDYKPLPLGTKVEIVN